MQKKLMLIQWQMWVSQNMEKANIYFTLAFISWKKFIIQLTKILPPLINPILHSIFISVLKKQTRRRWRIGGGRRKRRRRRRRRGEGEGEEEEPKKRKSQKTHTNKQKKPRKSEIIVQTKNQLDKKCSSQVIWDTKTYKNTIEFVLCWAFIAGHGSYS